MESEKKAFEPIYFLHDGYDQIIDEKGSQFIALRKVQWCKDATTEKDPEKAHFELRRWRVDPEKGETPSKGVVFLTEDGPSNCVSGLIEAGFGDTKECLLKLKERDDFRDAVEHLYDESDTSDSNGAFFDARELLLNE
jgi:hypothetical protein